MDAAFRFTYHPASLSPIHVSSTSAPAFYEALMVTMAWVHEAHPDHALVEAALLRDVKMAWQRLSGPQRDRVIGLTVV